ncbi:hypothetical protein FSBG_00384 [Fusobacterium gonidiaformans 3-1-5R]|uniref:Toxin ToxN, type III toxin-antitoxin system n=1 Tax=Fusobacterium gonidiaformans 3-1-5R TaxID=469605 RepID=E5BFK6_9FUSO|nr:type III toxin-antitoxin system ToxN/AbiQ family toxin [Fusobacterium gonidiaformans]EFS20887.1 hypothetical protein FSBG_00384 [Fusobacterium gonidiaformans 3-1-5R]
MKLVNIKEEYIQYLQNFSTNVKYNKQEKRPYVGIILEIDHHTYFAPLGSPKAKHLKMKSGLDFIKIRDGRLGVINLNNMLPVPKEFIQKIDFSKYEEKYRILLQDQAYWIQENSKKIQKQGSKLYQFIITRENTIFHTRCNDFKLLEAKALEYLEKQRDISENSWLEKMKKEKHGIER